MGKIIGIDLGTTNSCVSVIENGVPTVIQNSEGGRTTPSIVGFTSKGDKIVGCAAKNQMVTNPKNTVYSVKSLMGRSFSEVKDDAGKLPYKVIDNGSDVRIELEDSGELKKFSPQEISAFILQKMKKTAEDYLGEEVTEAVITVPAYFNDTQRQCTKDAGKIAGLEVKRIINEPTAAALAYGIDKCKDKEKKIVVFDLGGGTFDVSVLEIADGVFEVLSTNGNTKLGGDSFDKKIIDWVISEFKKDTGCDLSNDSMALQRIREAAEKAKIELSSQTSTEINLPFITANESGPKHLVKTITRATFENLVDDLIELTKEPCKQALSDAKLSLEDIDEVLLVGGSSRIPKVQEVVKQMFGKEGNKGINPDEAVAIGAAHQGSILNGDSNNNSVLLLDVTPLNLGLETAGNVMTTLIPKNTTIPTSKSQIFSTYQDGQTAVDIHVLQGNRPMANDNKTLGMFRLDGIPAAARGTPQIEVTFSVDANSILEVSAKDLATGKEQHITITNNGNLSEEEIERMRKDAEEHEAEDKKKKDAVDTKNEAEGLVYQTESTLKDLGDKVTDSEKADIEKAVSELKETIEKDDLPAIKEKTESLKQLSYKLAEKIYKSQQQDNPNGQSFDFTEELKKAQNMKGSADDVEYEVKDE